MEFHKVEYKGFTIYLEQEANKEWYYSIIGPNNEDYGTSTGSLPFRKAALDAKLLIDDIIESPEDYI
jgi:hypothetical protein